MPFSLSRSLLVLLSVFTVTTAFAAKPQISTSKPFINFRLGPTFNEEGFRAWLVRGSEARYLSDNQIDVKELSFSIFTGKADEKVATLILSPSARVQPDDVVVTGEESIRVINDDFEATGTGWRYAHTEKKVLIRNNVRVSFAAEFEDFLK